MSKRYHNSPGSRNGQGNETPFGRDIEGRRAVFVGSISWLSGSMTSQDVERGGQQMGPGRSDMGKKEQVIQLDRKNENGRNQDVSDDEAGRKVSSTRRRGREEIEISTDKVDTAVNGLQRAWSDAEWPLATAGKAPHVGMVQL